MPQRATILMYHELRVEGRPLIREESGYALYAVPEQAFREQVARLSGIGKAGSVGSLFAATGRPSIVVTFDDGCETDFTIAAPVLREAGHGATFYVTSGWIGKGGHLSAEQVRALAGMGFEIGSHGQTHRFLSRLSAADLRAELRDSRARLEDLTGSAVVHLSCPGGRRSARVIEEAALAGYQTVATSRAGVNRLPAHRFALRRIPVTRSMDLGSFERVSRGRGIAAMTLRWGLLSSAKRVLGDAVYDSLRASLLGRKREDRV